MHKFRGLNAINAQKRAFIINAINAINAQKFWVALLISMNWWQGRDVVSSDGQGEN